MLNANDLARVYEMVLNLSGRSMRKGERKEGEEMVKRTLTTGLLLNSFANFCGVNSFLGMPKSPKIEICLFLRKQLYCEKCISNIHLSHTSGLPSFNATLFGFG